MGFNTCKQTGNSIFDGDTEDCAQCDWCGEWDWDWRVPGVGAIESGDPDIDSVQVDRVCRDCIQDLGLTLDSDGILVPAPRKEAA